MSKIIYANNEGGAIPDKMSCRDIHAHMLIVGH